MTWQSMDFYPPSVTIKVLNGAILYDLGECLLVVGSVMGVMWLGNGCNFLAILLFWASHWWQAYPYWVADFLCSYLKFWVMIPFLLKHIPLEIPFIIIGAGLLLISLIIYWKKVKGKEWNLPTPTLLCHTDIIDFQKKYLPLPSSARLTLFVEKEQQETPEWKLIEEKKGINASSFYMDSSAVSSGGGSVCFNGLGNKVLNSLLPIIATASMLCRIVIGKRT